MATEEIITFDDLMGLLERNPEHLARLRRQILDEEFQQLPAEVRSLVETVQSHTRTLETHTAMLQSIVERLDNQNKVLESHSRLLETHTAMLQSMVERLDNQNKVLESHSQAVLSHTRMLEGHTATLTRHERQLNRLLGDEAERRFQRNAAGYFGHLLRRIRLVDPSILADDIDDAIDAGFLTEGDRRSLMALDVVVRGLDRDTRQETRLAVEVSSGIGERDIMRAADRSGLLEKLTGHTAMPVVAGYSISSAYRQLAEDKGVTVVVVAPPDAGEPEETDEPDAATDPA